MQNAIILPPKATLYESITVKNNFVLGQHVSDELLSGWLVTIQECQGNFSKIITEYGYSGWLMTSETQNLPQSSYHLWRLCPHSNVLITSRLTDILTAPNVQAARAATIFMGSSVLPLEPAKEGWQKIKLADNTVGYVPAIALTPVIEQKESESQIRCNILNYALSYLGAQYRWGGKTHDGIDCSGLAFMSYYMCGIFIYRDAAIKAGYPVQEIPIVRIKPADLLYFPGHVALYLGGGKYIHSTGNIKNFGCVINSLNPCDADYREDLANSLTAVGSVFPYICK